MDPDLDVEVTTLRAVAEALDGLAIEQQDRILNWACSYFLAGE